MKCKYWVGGFVGGFDGWDVHVMSETEIRRREEMRREEDWKEEEWRRCSKG